jgi:hypothetical protein
MPGPFKPSMAGTLKRIDLEFSIIVFMIGVRGKKEVPLVAVAARLL